VIDIRFSATDDRELVGGYPPPDGSMPPMTQFTVLLAFEMLP
jgi:hypothetical protein